MKYRITQESVGQTIELPDSLELIGDQPPPPQPAGVPVLTIRNNSFNVPILQGQGNQRRGWFFPAVVYSNSEFHCFSPCDDADGHRNLYTNILGQSGRRMLRRKVEQVTVWKIGGTFYLSGIEKESNGNDKLFNGISTDRTNWTWTDADQPDTGGYPTGDIHTATISNKVLIKGHNYVKDSTGKVIEYFRPWYCEGQECTGWIPPPPPDGLRYSVYTMGIFEPLEHGWQSRTRYVAIVGLFKITDPAPTGWQHGPIDLVWATSDNGSDWTLPWGDDHAIQEDSLSQMTTSSYNPIAWGDELRIYAGINHYGHNAYNPGDIAGMGLCTLPKIEFEAKFG